MKGFEHSSMDAQAPGAGMNIFKLSLGLIGLFFMTSVAQAVQPQRLNANGVALCADRDSKADGDCYDPVSYFTDKKAVKAGSENAKKFRVEHDGATYVFSSQKNLESFKEKPANFVPAYGGWCAYAVADSSDKVDIDPESFLVQDGRLLVFFNKFYARTRNTWQTDSKKTAAQYLKEGDAHWPAVKEKAP